MSRASLRTGGFARTASVPGRGATCVTDWTTGIFAALGAPTVATGASAGAGVFTGVGSVSAATCTGDRPGATDRAGVAGAGAGVAGAAGSWARRARRVVLPAAIPYPTSTAPLSALSVLPVVPAFATTFSAVLSDVLPASAPSGALGAVAAPVGSVSMTMMATPTSTIVPIGWRISVTTPAYGEGSSTSDLAVSISTIAWFTVTVSPTPTCHVTISASVRPSPASGRLKRSKVGMVLLRQSGSS